MLFIDNPITPSLQMRNWGSEIVKKNLLKARWLLNVVWSYLLLCNKQPRHLWLNNNLLNSWFWTWAVWLFWAQWCSLVFPVNWWIGWGLARLAWPQLTHLCSTSLSNSNWLAPAPGHLHLGRGSNLQAKAIEYLEIQAWNGHNTTSISLLFSIEREQDSRPRFKGWGSRLCMEWLVRKQDTGRENSGAPCTNHLPHGATGFKSTPI